jgi:hypothetical protein
MVHAAGERRPSDDMHLNEFTADQFEDRDAFRAKIVESCRPAIIRGLVASWPAVVAGKQSAEQLKQHVLQFDRGASAEVFVGEPGIAGKYYYSADLQGFNFERREMRFADALENIVATCGDANGTSLYVGSLPINSYLPGFAQQNALPIFNQHVEPRIWVGHASNVSTHYDTFDNVACVVAGTRRVRLFAPEAIDRLYVGPLDYTMAGQPVSLAASAPDAEERFPRFREVKDQALIAELHAGDAIYIPKLWWHQIEATDRFNVLVNYWWDAFSVGPDAPSTGLLLSMIAIAERPFAERQAWKAFFDHYVFRTNGHPLAHLPESQHGILGPLKPHNYGRIRSRIMHLLRGE